MHARPLFSLSLAIGLGLCLLTTTGHGDDSARVEVAAYYFPNWGPLPMSEWGLIKWAKPQFEGHLQPKAAAALGRFRERARAAGFPGLHLNAVLYGLPRDTRDEVIRRLGFDSATSYVWTHHYPLPDFPATDYAKAADGYFRAVTKGGG